MTKLATLFLLTVLTAVTSLAAPVTSGPVGFAHQVNKYLLDNGVDPVTAHQSGALEISRIDGRDVITQWGLAPLPLPDSEQLDAIADALSVVNVPESARVKEGGKYRLKTKAELKADKASTPEGSRAARREAARVALMVEITSVSATNAPTYTDDVHEWMAEATLTAAQEKKIGRLLERYEALASPKIRVDRAEE